MPLAHKPFFLIGLQNIVYSLNLTLSFWLIGKEIQIKTGRSASKNSFMGFLTWLGAMMRKTNIPHILMIQQRLQPKYYSLSLTKMVMGTEDVNSVIPRFTYDFLTYDDIHFMSTFGRYLTDLEMLPIIGKLHPSERYYAKQQADYVISQV